MFSTIKTNLETAINSIKTNLDEAGDYIKNIFEPKIDEAAAAKYNTLPAELKAIVKANNKGQVVSDVIVAIENRKPCLILFLFDFSKPNAAGKWGSTRSVFELDAAAVEAFKAAYLFECSTNKNVAVWDEMYTFFGCDPTMITAWKTAHDTKKAVPPVPDPVDYKAIVAGAAAGAAAIGAGVAAFVFRNELGTAGDELAQRVQELINTSSHA